MLVFGMMIVGYALFETGVVVIIGRSILKTKFAQNERLLLGVVMFLAGIISAFLSNTATVATFIPLIAAMVSASGGRLNNKNILMGIGMAASVGGTMTLVGSTSQQMASGILEKASFGTLAMFDFAPVAFPLFIVLIVYMVTIGYKIQDKVLDYPDIKEDVDISEMEKFKPTSKTYIAAGIMVFCIVGFSLEIWNTATVALVGAAAVLLTGCVDFKSAMKNVDWNTVLLIAFAQGIASGMNDSGAGAMIAEWTVKAVGTNHWLLFSMCIIVSVVLTNIMSNTAVAAMMVPIYIQIAVGIGINPYVFAMGIAIGSNCSVATPIGGSAMSQILVAGYRFKDYLKIGIPITIVLTIMTIILTPLVFGFNPM